MEEQQLATVLRPVGDVVVAVVPEAEVVVVVVEAVVAVDVDVWPLTTGTVTTASTMITVPSQGDEEEMMREGGTPTTTTMSVVPRVVRARNKVEVVAEAAPDTATVAVRVMLSHATAPKLPPLPKPNPLLVDDRA